jgi:hypothetical protein
MFEQLGSLPQETAIKIDLALQRAPDDIIIVC